MSHELFYNQQATMETEVDAKDVENYGVINLKNESPQKKITYITEQYGIEHPNANVADNRDNRGQYSANNGQSLSKTQSKGKVEKITFDRTSVTEKTVVYHKTFGQGTVVKMDKAQKHIRVKFAIGEKTFIFPDAFINGFLEIK